jgi:uncharacterized protein (DUF1499 family)
MTILLSVILLLIAAVVVLFVILGVQSRTGTAPGLVEGRLARCPATPNCVCSEYKNDISHYIEPVSFADNNPMSIIKSVIKTAGGTIQSETDNYLAATFSSAVFGFVDDVEVRLDAKQRIIQLRSAARVGRGDMGVNRKRVQKLKQMLNEKLNKNTNAQ